MKPKTLSLLSIMNLIWFLCFTGHQSFHTSYLDRSPFSRSLILFPFIVPFILSGVVLYFIHACVKHDVSAINTYHPAFFVRILHFLYIFIFRYICSVKDYFTRTVVMCAPSCHHKPISFCYICDIKMLYEFDIQGKYLEVYTAKFQYFVHHPKSCFGVLTWPFSLFPRKKASLLFKYKVRKTKGRVKD